MFSSRYSRNSEEWKWQDRSPQCNQSGERSKVNNVSLWMSLDDKLLHCWWWPFWWKGAGYTTGIICRGEHQPLADNPLVSSQVVLNPPFPLCVVWKGVSLHRVCSLWPRRHIDLHKSCMRKTGDFWSRPFIKSCLNEEAPALARACMAPYSWSAGVLRVGPPLIWY